MSSGPPGRAPTLRFLLIVPIYAASLMTGGGQRSFHLFRALAAHGRVDVLLVSEESLAVYERDIAALRQTFPGAGRVLIQRSTPQFISWPGRRIGWFEKTAFTVKRVHSALKTRATFYRPTGAALDALRQAIASERYDLLVGRYLQATALAGAFEQDDVPVVVDLDDLDEKVIRSRLDAVNTAWYRRWLLHRHAGQVDRMVERLRAQARHLFTASESDRAHIGQTSSSVLVNIPFLRDGAAKPAFAPSPPDSSVVLFVGSFGHRLNRDGLLHFIDRCWPLITARVAHATLRVVGSGGWENIRDEVEATRGVVVVGAVDDLSAEYAGAAFCVVPMLEGSGTKIKVVEALLHGRLVVATEHSAYGYEMLVGKGLISARNTAEMADTCVSLLGSPERRDALAAVGHSIVEANFSFDAVQKTVDAALDGIRPGA